MSAGGDKLIPLVAGVARYSGRCQNCRVKIDVRVSGIGEDRLPPPATLPGPSVVGGETEVECICGELLELRLRGWQRKQVVGHG